MSTSSQSSQPTTSLTGSATGVTAPTPSSSGPNTSPETSSEPTSAIVTTSSISSTSLSTTSHISAGSTTSLTSSGASSLNSTSTSSAAATSSKPADEPSLSSGAVAGISVGTFFAGVVIALICVCLVLMLRKKKRTSYDSASRRQQYRDTEYSQEYGTPMKQMTSGVQPLGVGTDIDLNRVLLEPVSSNDIKADMLAIGSQILQHVDNNYHLKPVDSLPATFTENLTRDGYSVFTGISIEQLGEHLLNAKTRRAAIRHLISYFIFSKIPLTSEVETSLLPHHIIAFLRQVPPPESASGSRQAFDQALTKWRLLSAYLLQTVRSNRDPLLPKDSDIQRSIKRLVATAEQILAPFVIPGAERRQVDNIDGLMAEGARFALLLFQHPETWVVDWQVPRTQNEDPKAGGSARSKPSAIVVFPGLSRTADAEGRRYGKIKVVLDAEVLQL